MHIYYLPHLIYQVKILCKHPPLKTWYTSSNIIILINNCLLFEIACVWQVLQLQRVRLQKQKKTWKNINRRSLETFDTFPHSLCTSPQVILVTRGTSCFYQLRILFYYKNLNASPPPLATWSEQSFIIYNNSWYIFKE